ncbi:hypothetical protein V502_05188 [Pseudogymnoascus sp. VKM F-4520 (FW-2644)]|nr:hypothetical protein V502_05188 [Pseudogymnoascus sp. VKM F-4520 (FW-2644)]
MATTTDHHSPQQAEAQYTLPNTYARLSEISSPAPEENPGEGGWYDHDTLEEVSERERGERVRGGGEDAEQEEEEEVGCLCKVVKGWVKRAIRRRRGG